MRTLVYGMQSSGASLFTYFLCQRPDTIGIIDLWSANGFVAPALEDTDKDVILKCTATPVVPLERHVASFKPDVTILFLRDKRSNVERLARKGYRDEGGGMNEKFAQLDRDVERGGLFDLVLTYEDFVNAPPTILGALGELAAPSYYEFSRTKREMLAFARAHSAWCREYYRKRWGFGNIHFEKDGSVTLSSATRERPGALVNLYRELREYLRDYLSDRG